jgi:hypothetical protein
MVLVLTGGVLTPVGGCLTMGDHDDRSNTESGSSDSPSSPTHTPSATEAELTFEIQFEEGPADGPVVQREQVTVTNRSAEHQYVSGYTLAYSSGYEYAISGGVTLEPHATLAIVSQGEGASVAESEPPTYYQDAALPELVLTDGQETVRLLNYDDEPVVTATYDGAT